MWSTPSRDVQIFRPRKVENHSFLIEGISMKNIVYAIPLALALVGMLVGQHAFATHELTSQTDHSPAWNAGYSQGYNGYNLTGSHTTGFFFGYMNGTSDFWYNKGYACGVSGRTVYNNTVGFCGLFSGISDIQEKRFNSGNDTGWTNRINMRSSEPDSDHLLQILLSINTTDGYKDYFAGFANGIRFYEDVQNGPGKYVNAFNISCNGTAEYCTGFKAGWNEDEYNQD